MDYASGFGRRYGIHAWSTLSYPVLGPAEKREKLWLSTFNVSEAKGPDGLEVQIDPDALTDGVIRQAQDWLYWRIFSDVLSSCLLDCS